MLRLNLKKPTMFGTVIQWGYAVMILSVLFAVQIIFLFGKMGSAREKNSEILKMQVIQQDLLQQIAEFKTISDIDDLAGALRARNMWITAKEKSPVRLLAELEKTQPKGAAMISLDAGDGGGFAKVSVPHLDLAISWFNQAFAKRTGRFSVEDKTPGRMTVRFEWAK